MTRRFPLTELALGEQDVLAVLDALDSGWLTMGPRTAAFEQAFAEYSGAVHAVAVMNGTAALHLALLAAGVGPGDEVVLPALSFVSDASTVRMVGGTPVPAEVIGATDMNLDPVDVEQRMTERTKAVICVHFAGYPARVEQLAALCEDRGVTLVEDCAHAVGGRLADGTPVGTGGTLGCFSFFSKTQLPTGEGGMVVTDDTALADRVRSLRSHGMTSVTWDRHRGHAESYDVIDIGFNYRMDEPRAALGTSRLAVLDDDVAGRRAAAQSYRSRLAGLDGLELPWSDEDVGRSAHFAFAVLLPDRERRDGFRAALEERGVQTTWYESLHRFSEYRTVWPGLELPRSEQAADRHCMLPMHARLGGERVEEIAAEVEAVLQGPLQP